MDQVRALLEEGHNSRDVADLLGLDVERVKAARHTAWHRDTDYQRTRRAQTPTKEPTP